MLGMSLHCVRISLFLSLGLGLSPVESAVLIDQTINATLDDQRLVGIILRSLCLEACTVCFQGLHAVEFFMQCHAYSVAIR